MSKTEPPAGRRRPGVSKARRSHRGGASRRSDSPARLDTRDPRRLLDRILDTPQLAQAIPRLRPELLHRLIERCGLEDCGEIVAMATPAQLTGVFDLDLWRTEQPGLDEQFDADRFGVWIEVLLESGADLAARTLAEVNVDLAVAALAQHMRVFDPAALSAAATEDGELAGIRITDDGLRSEVGGYLIVATRTDSWDAIVAVLLALEADHHEHFHRVMAGCRSLSDAGAEIDGLDDLLDDREQILFDLAFDRERRQEKQGYVTATQARAFLQMSRQCRLEAARPPGNPVSRAYFRAMESTAAVAPTGGASRLPAASGEPSAPDDSATALAAVVDLLHETGVLPRQPRALLGGAEGRRSRLARIEAQMQLTRERDEAVYSTRAGELAYLANTILAGCSIQARVFTPQEAADAAVAVCNLGLENWPLHWLPADARRGPAAVAAGPVLADDFLLMHDLVGVFQVGWAVLYARVCLDAAELLIAVLGRLRCPDLETQRGLDELRLELGSSATPERPGSLERGWM